MKNRNIHAYKETLAKKFGCSSLLSFEVSFDASVFSVSAVLSVDTSTTASFSTAAFSFSISNSAN